MSSNVSVVILVVQNALDHQVASAQSAKTLRPFWMGSAQNAIKQEQSTNSTLKSLLMAHAQRFVVRGRESLQTNCSVMTEMILTEMAAVKTVK